ncbi:unnamed protein product [Gemmata massiliana]|uniref:Uncharacterized protein n=1 Tax=Gemmata massiliana TaxID=1210884 RepID=A0A6P2D1Q0_9BACT|nr:hypothetical protein [Gemmata massiliana]VTR93352.1 unnamed protein product [Gemmata massiliana]
MTLKMSLSEIVDQVQGQFRNGVPNGWLLGWKLDRGYATINESIAPHKAANMTTFDYCFCNYYELMIGNDYPKFALAIRISFIVPAYSLHWTRYDSEHSGVVTRDIPVAAVHIENKIRSTIDGLGYFELPSDWHDKEINDVILELSDTDSVTLGKCLFCDYAQ